MPKVLIVIARLNVGGTAQYIGELVNGMQNNGFQALVATGFVQGAEREDAVVASLPIHRIKSLGRKIDFRNDLRARQELAELIDLFQPEIIYSHTFKAGLLARTIKTDVPRIHAFHGHLLTEPELAGWRARVVTLIERWLAPRARFLVTVGEKVARELLAERVGKSAQYRPIAPGVRALELENRSAARKALGIEEEMRPIVVWMARVTAVKAPIRVIELARIFPEARFLLAGGGDLLEKFSKDLPENLTVLGWQTAHRIWAVADIAISTSENEGMPVALIEAQLAGVPVVGIDVGSVSEVIDDSETGFVVSQWGDQFTSKLGELLASSELRQQFSNHAVAQAKTKFSPERLITEHLKLFGEVLR